MGSEREFDRVPNWRGLQSCRLSSTALGGLRFRPRLWRTTPMGLTSSILSVEVAVRCIEVGRRKGLELLHCMNFERSVSPSGVHAIRETGSIHPCLADSTATPRRPVCRRWTGSQKLVPRADVVLGLRGAVRISLETPIDIGRSAIWATYGPSRRHDHLVREAQ